MNLSKWRPSKFCRHTHVVTLKIGNQEWKALRYRQFDDNMMYVVGKLPEDWSKDNKFGIEIDGQKWYIMVFMDFYDDLSEHIKTYHPFGNNWG